MLLMYLFPSVITHIEIRIGIQILLDSLVEERLENNNLVFGFNEAHKGTQHAYKYKTKSVSHQ